MFRLVLMIERQSGIGTVTKVGRIRELSGSWQAGRRPWLLGTLSALVRHNKVDNVLIARDKVV